MYFRKLPSGSTQVIVQHNGVIRRGSAPSRSEAVILGAQFLVELGATPVLARDEASVDVVLSTHIEANRSRWASQYTGDLERVQSRLPAGFLARPAGGVAPADVAALYRHLEHNGWTAHRLQRTHGFLSGAFRRAVTHGWVRANPCTGVTPAMPPAADLVIPTARQVADLVAATPDDLRRIFMRVAAITGARRGELVGLQWIDLSTEREEIVIRRARALDKTGVPYTGPGKTGRRGHRVLTLDPVTIEALGRHHDHVQIEEAAAGKLPPPVWIFSDDGGATPWPPDKGSDTFNEARIAAKIPKVRLHDLRHFVATSMLQAGESPIDVAGQLGDTVQTVLRTYAHYLPGRGRDAALRRAQLLA